MAEVGTRYRMSGKVYTLAEIRKAIQAELAEAAIEIENAGGTAPEAPSVEDYLTESVHTGTIEIVGDL